MREKPILDHPGLPPFEPQLKAFLDCAFDGGVRSLQAAGYKLGDDLVNDHARECFAGGLFSACAQTQSEVGALFIALEEKRQELAQLVKQLRSHPAPQLPDTETQLEAIGNRQLILRRLMDGILWVLFSHLPTLRHLAIKKDVSQPDPHELRKLLSIASELNRSGKREIHLVSDLTSMAQLGDLIRIRWDEEGLYIRLHEIKSGPMNNAIGDLIDGAGGVLSETDLAAIETRFGPHAKSQALRMVRQRRRFKEFEACVQGDISPRQRGGADPVVEALAGVKAPRVGTYLLKLPDLVADAKARGIGVHGVDGCLWLVALTEEGLGEIGGAANLPHVLFHLKHPKVKCEREEIPALNKESPLVNLAVHNMKYVMSRSPLIWYPKDLVLDVVMDRVRVYAQFDLEAFFKLAKLFRLELSLIVGKEAEEGKRAKQSTPMLENPKSYGVKVRFCNGRVFNLRSSLFRSVYSFLVPPSEIIKVILALEKAQRRIGASEPQRGG